MGRVGAPALTVCNFCSPKGDNNRNMKHAAVVLILTAAPILAGGISDSERASLIDHLNKTKAKFHAAVAGLSEAQYNFKAAPERWSIAECAEHIAVSEDMIRSLVTDRVLKTPASPDNIAVRVKNDAMILTGLTDRSQKFKAPEMLQPTRRFATLQEAVAHFGKSRQQTLDYAKTSTDDLRSHAAPHPVFKEMDGYQWLLLLSGHSERHTLQILEVKAEPTFPKQ